ncbi:MAG: M24 family metallopeptidase, partial [Pseudomonadota bacterium]
VGDQINIELGGVRRRYNAGLARSIFLGPTPDPIKRLADATCDAVEAALAALKPGTVAEDVYFAYSDALSKHGKEKTSRIGYAIGAAYPPAWVDASVSFWPGDRTVLAAGMTFHLMCGMWMGDTGFVQSETVLISADGYELLTNYPQGLVEKQTSGTSGTTKAPRGRGS